MKNLVAELDLLETKLNQIKELDHESKLYRTRFLIEKSKHIDDSIEPEELELKVQSIKQELANRKLYHCIKQVSRQARTFKQMEPLKLKKRIKNAAPEKKEALEAELEFVKNINVDEWAEYVAKAQLSKYFGAMLGFEKRQISSTESNVYGRFGGMAALKQVINSAVSAISEYYTPENITTKSTVAQKEETKLKDKKSKKDKKEKKEKPSKEEKPKENKSQDKQKENSEAKIEPDTNKDFQEDFVSLPDVSMDSDGDMAMSPEPLEDDFFVGADGSALPQLATGYISGSDSEDEPEPDVLKPERKNRRGQRARRAIWEKKYGRGAKHVVKERQEDQKKIQEKQTKREFRVQKDRQRQEAAQKRLERKRELDAKPLHPSWAAKQQQEKMQSAKPAGKKIVFD